MAVIQLHHAEEQDFQKIKDLIRETGINPFGLDWHRFIIAETENGVFAGCGQLKPHRGGIIELASIVVIPGFRRHGVATKIIIKLLEKSDRPIYLMCRSSLEGFYSRFGFHQVNIAEMPGSLKKYVQVGEIIHSLAIMHDRLLVMVLD